MKQRVGIAHLAKESDLISDAAFLSALLTSIKRKLRANPLLMFGDSVKTSFYGESHRASAELSGSNNTFDQTARQPSKVVLKTTLNAPARAPQLLFSRWKINSKELIGSLKIWLQAQNLMGGLAGLKTGDI